MSLFGDELPEMTATTPYRVLARKYRPTTFDDLIGQDTMVRILRNAFALGRVAHAYLLTGVRGVGKTTTARIIARAMNCTGPDGNGGPTADPCGICPDCVAILADRHPDVTEMDAASRTGVDDVREIIEATRYRPIQARARVFIIDEVHMLSRNAFNALLKTLEEPPPHVRFIFATTEIRKVPVTVLSRCQSFALRRVSLTELSAWFGRIAEREKVTVEPEALALIARAADGSVRDGLSLLDQSIAQAEPGAPVTVAAVTEMLGAADRGSLFDLVDAIMAGRVADALAITDRAHEQGADLGVLLADLLDLLNTLTRLKVVPTLRDGMDLPELERTRGATLADTLDVATIGRAWQMLLKGIQEVETAPDRRAAAEMVLIRLCYVADLPTPGDLVRRLHDAPPAVASVAPVPRSSGGVTRGALALAQPVAVAVAVEAVAVEAAAVEAVSAPAVASWRDAVALVEAAREATLHAHLLHSAHFVSLRPGVIELRLQPEAPRELPARLAEVLRQATGTRWTIALSAEPGQPTLHEQGRAAEGARHAKAAAHPLMQAILDAFPGAVIEAAQAGDRYGLEPEIPADLPSFAPVDALPAYNDDDQPMED